ncbi:MAG: Hsp20/alpha crystallin family protein [Halobacteriovoraceae bacterium]|nr:Hsp20/alpha crystallin family protein [Halobacteriovoraceae bacterium]MCB9095563.1 Hsp20/alpha crystallin family protein [Halobacteriovoraceae bacterium]
MNGIGKMITVGVLGVLLGIGGTYLFTNYNLVEKKSDNKQVFNDSFDYKSKGFDSFFDKTFDDDFFGKDFSPFKQMEKMRENMNRLFEDQFNNSLDNKYFDNWFEGRFGGSVFDIGESEDDKFVYYRIQLDGVDQNNLKIDVSNGQLNISGVINKESEKSSQGSLSKSRVSQSFKRSFPVPLGVDADKVEFETKENEIIVKFPKT